MEEAGLWLFWALAKLARQLWHESLSIFIHPIKLTLKTLVAALSDAKTVLEPLKDIVVIEEVQQRPDLFPVLRVLLDRKPLPAKFLILGSASPGLLRQSSESLAGCLAFVEIGGFDLAEVGAKKVSKLWVRGGFPLSFLAKNDVDSFAWRKDFIKTFLGWDLRGQGVDIPTVTLHRFWATHQGAEIDLILSKGGQIYGVEVKRADAPKMLPSMGIALEDLKLDQIAVIYPGKKRYSLHKKIEVVPFDEVLGGKNIFK